MLGPSIQKPARPEWLQLQHTLQICFSLGPNPIPTLLAILRASAVGLATKSGWNGSFLPGQFTGFATTSATAFRSTPNPSGTLLGFYPVSADGLIKA